MTTTTAEVSPVLRNTWLRRVGIAGFWFFLVKGLLWIAAPFVFYFAL